ncbi:MAG TPA: hypothetical protein PKD53_11430 [Chloroflexaceae bacterium]|mgnify:CR=1 FL=1|nr:hypothetical protein [Chloroflexaceae bacterium]
MDQKRSPRFARLLKAGLNSIATLEGKTGPAVDAEIGRLTGRAGPSLQRYRSGYLPSDHQLTATVAELAVARGLLGRPWLEQFLNAARYPAYDARALVERLFPSAAAPARAAPQTQLPPPSFVRFIMRGQAYSAVLDGLRSHLPLTIVTSMGGMGKTSLARVVAGDCTTGRATPAFDLAVWVSDGGLPGTTNLSTLLDEVARALSYPGLAALPFAEKQREVERLLRAQPVLLVLDNAETVGDAALLEWLAHLPPPSRALVTSRAALPAHLPACQVDLAPLDAAQARELIVDRLQQSHLRGVPGALEQLLPLAEAAGGNPKAIELAVGLVQRERRPVAEVAASLAGASIETLFTPLFAGAWQALDAGGMRTLFALTLFPASAAEAALLACAALAPGNFRRTATQLAELSLLDIQWADLLAPPRYALHPLVRAYAAARLAERPAEAEALRERWLAWCVQLAARVGFCWDDLGRLDLLDGEHETVQAALEWAAAAGRDQAVISLAEGVRYYYNVRGLWDERRLANYAMRAEAARRLGDAAELVLALSQHCEVLSKQTTLAEAEALLARAEQVALGATLSDDAAFELGHARGLLAYTRGDLARAEACWRSLLPFAATLGGQKYVINRRWLAGCLCDLGREDEAIVLYRASLADAEACNDTRSITGNSLRLAALDIERGNLERAEAELARCRELAERHQDGRRLAEYYELAADLLAARGDRARADAALAAATDLLARMGMRGRAEALQARRARAEPRHQP